MPFEKNLHINQNMFTNSFSLKPITFKFANDPINVNVLKNRRRENCSNKTLIIVPGYSVSNPPRIGDHQYYIQALQYHPIKNPNGYKQIYVFNLYSKKDGRCNFHHDIPALAKELMISIDTTRDNWLFQYNGEIDFIGASMGGLIVRKFIQDNMTGENQIISKLWGRLRIRNIVLIATPNYGCKIVDLLQNPIIQLILRIFHGKDNFSQSQQVQQISVGEINVWEPIFRYLIRKFTPVNTFIRNLNSTEHTPGSIRWITIRGTRRKWFTIFIYDKKTLNDGVVSADSVPLKGAENISDKDLGFGISWNHRDLYKNEGFCNFLAGLLIHNMKMIDYQQNSHLIFKHKIASKMNPQRKYSLRNSQIPNFSP